MLRTKSRGLLEAVGAINTLMYNGKLIDIIGTCKRDPIYTTITIAAVQLYADHFLKTRVTVVTYKSPWYKYAYRRARGIKVLGYVSDHKKIHVDSRYLKGRSISSIAGSLAHEWIHCLEYFINKSGGQARIGHGDNSSIGKESTIPYKVGREVKQHLEASNGKLIRAIKCRSRRF